MGTLVYGTAGIEVPFDDRVLAHLQAVFSLKLRRRQSFFFNWRQSPSSGEGRGALWIDTSVPLYFRYSGSRVPALDQGWLEQMVLAADSAAGLVLSEDPAPPNSGAATAGSSAARSR